MPNPLPPRTIPVALDYALEPPGADGPPLVTQVFSTARSLRFVMSLDSQPRGLWRTELLQALREELVIMESRLRTPVHSAAVPPDLPMPTAIVATVVAEDPAVALQEWAHALLRAFRNLSMAHGIAMPRLLATQAAGRKDPPPTPAASP